MPAHVYRIATSEENGPDDPIEVSPREARDQPPPLELYSGSDETIAFGLFDQSKRPVALGEDAVVGFSIGTTRQFDDAVLSLDSDDNGIEVDSLGLKFQTAARGRILLSADATRGLTGKKFWQLSVSEDVTNKVFARGEIVFAPAAAPPG